MWNILTIEQSITIVLIDGTIQSFLRSTIYKFLYAEIDHHSKTSTTSDLSS